MVLIAPDHTTQPQPNDNAQPLKRYLANKTMNDSQANLNDLIFQFNERVWRRKKTVSEITRDPALGDGYFFDILFPNFVIWVAVREDRDDPNLLYMLPADDELLVGNTDVHAEESELNGEVVLRCGYGVWVSREQLALGRRVAVFDESVIKEARVRLSYMVTGSPIPVPDHTDINLTVEYQEWMDRIELAPVALQGFLNIVPPDSGDKTGKENEIFKLAFDRPKLSLAAKSDSPVVDATQSLGASIKGITPIPCGGAGNLVAVHDDQGLRLHFDPFLPEVRIDVETTGENDFEAVTWEFVDDAFVSNDLMPEGDKLRIRLPKFSVEYEISVSEK